jgi:O-antigen/teichoic acid export membrane protein
MASNVIGISVALLRLQSPVRVSFGRGVRRHYRVIWPEVTWSLVGVTTWNIQGQTPTFLVAAIVGPAAYAPIAAGLVLFSPLRPAVGAFINVVRPVFAASLAAKRYADVRLTLYGLLGVITLCCIGLGMAFWLGWAFLEQHIFAGKFANASMPLIVVLAGVATLLAQSYFMPLTLLQARRDFKTVALATTFGGAVGLLATLILLFTSGVAWSLAGLAAGEAVCWIYLWLSALRMLNDTRMPPPAFALASDRPPRASRGPK